MRWSILLVLAVPVASSHATALQDLFALQRDGLWEARAPGNPTPMRRYCITGEVRLDAVKATAEAFAAMGCKADQESVKGGSFEVSYACSNANPDIGNFRLVMFGSAGPNQMSVTTQVSGGGPMIQSMAPGMNVTEEWRRARDCLPTEKPGLQP
jgi:Protein of unknown function (DUF3617)